MAGERTASLSMASVHAVFVSIVCKWVGAPGSWGSGLAPPYTHQKVVLKSQPRRQRTGGRWQDLGHQRRGQRSL